MSTTERRGRFITFEGGDGSGKTTQMRLLARRLRAMGFEVLETAEPGGTPIGMQIRRILLDSANQELCPTAELLLYFAARAQNVEEWIKPALDRGAVVLSDRFTDSTLAYQGAGRGLGHSVVMALHLVACGGLNPDRTICIDIDVETSLARAHARNLAVADKDEKRMDEQATDFHRRVRQSYRELANEFPERIRMIDGNAHPELVSTRVWDAV
ncbi:MAG TPA: dTMP kinase, partial [Bryobacteraceae bacterium]|nr:dTMP kinase [Bryobacteraceae bacterium]